MRAVHGYRHVQPGGVFAIASADGREWFEATDPPQFAMHAAAIGADRVAASSDEDVEEGWIAISTSANGLDWGDWEALPLSTRDADGGIWVAAAEVDDGTPSLARAGLTFAPATLWPGSLIRRGPQPHFAGKRAAA